MEKGRQVERSKMGPPILIFYKKRKKKRQGILLKVYKIRKFSFRYQVTNLFPKLYSHEFCHILYNVYYYYLLTFSSMHSWTSFCNQVFHLTGSFIIGVCASAGGVSRYSHNLFLSIPCILYTMYHLLTPKVLTCTKLCLSLMCKEF